MNKLIKFALAVALIATPALAERDTYFSAALTAGAPNTTDYELKSDDSTMGCEITGTWTGTVNFFGTKNKKTTYQNLIGLLDALPAGSKSSTVTANASMKFPVDGLTHVKVTFAPASSGSPIVTCNASPTPFSPQLTMPTVQLDSGGSTAQGASAGSATNLSSANEGNKALVVIDPGELAVIHQPVAATQSTISVAAGGAGVRHVARGAVVCISAVAAQPDIIFNLRDGATGAGTVKFTWRLAAAAGTSKCEYLPPGSSIYGTANTAMTLESAVAPAATNFASVSLGYIDAN
jgi:hypothetical protein